MSVMIENYVVARHTRQQAKIVIKYRSEFVEEKKNATFCPSLLLNFHLQRKICWIDKRQNGRTLSLFLSSLLFGSAARRNLSFPQNSNAA
jgi:hypothetical protein